MISAQTKDFLSGTLQQVDIHGIEKELGKLWMEADKSIDSQDPHVTRACALNFIAFLSDDQNQEELENMVADIAIKHPCRAILAYAFEDKDQSLDAWVTARCNMVGGSSGEQICCEQIIIKWRGTGTKNLVSVVAPIAIPDLPTCMWWHKDEIDIDKLNPFIPHIDRFIVDSYCIPSTNKKPALLQLQSVADSLTEGSCVYDLNWLRTLTFRQSIAHSFDQNRGLLKIEDLDLISSIEIIEQGDNQPDTEKVESAKMIGSQSFLLLGWIASKLDWKLESAEEAKDGYYIYFRLNRSRIKAHVRQKFDFANPELKGHLREVRIRFRNDDKNLLRVWPDKASPGLRTARTLEDNIDEADISYNLKSQVDLISMILNDPKKPLAFEQALKTACSITRKTRMEK